MADGADSVGGAVTQQDGGPPLLLGVQYARDVVFRVPGAPGIYAVPDLRPHVVLQIDVQVRQSDDKQPVYEVALLMGCTGFAQEPVAGQPAPPVVYTVELAYCGIFTLRSVAPDAVEPVLFAECPRMLFPFARRVLADLTREAGFPPVMPQPFDFIQFWQERRAARQAQQAAEAEAQAQSRASNGDTLAGGMQHLAFTP